jgi:hypothetical protein
VAALLALLAASPARVQRAGRGGKKTSIHIGTYTTQGALEPDIQRYALGT